MRVILDENVPGYLAEWVAPRGVSTVADEGWTNLSDEEILSRLEGRDAVLLTFREHLLYRNDLHQRRISLVTVRDEYLADPARYKARLVRYVRMCEKGREPGKEQMTYFRFHLLFNLPATLALLALAWLKEGHGSQWAAGEGWAALGVLAAVMVFTSPWDNDAVRRGIWGFPPGRYWRRIGFLPFEEYLFFVWQSVNVMLSVGWLLRVQPQLRTGEGTPVGAGNGIAVLLLLVFWAALGLRSRKRPFAARWNYAWHLLYWFLPVIVLQWCLAPALFLKLAPVLGAAALFWGTYYTAADVAAVRAGVWTFDDRQITGHRLCGILPWEEIAFFYLTSLLVAQSFLLLLPAVLR